MTPKIILISLLCSLALCNGLKTTKDGKQLPTVFEYYGGDERVSGITANSRSEGFMLNGKPLRILSGAIHYFRIHPDYWRDRLRKLRASGANMVETYVPWNLHEPMRGVYDFGQGGFEMSPFLDFRKFIKMAEEEDLLVMYRPGPYICAEWEYGGLPSWLVRDPEMQLRRSNAAYEERVRTYFNELLQQVKDLQWSQGGPIVMFQIENEYGNYGVNDKDHLRFLKQVFEENGLVEIFITSDSPLFTGDRGALVPEVLHTANFQVNPEGQLDALLEFQPDKPILVTEYWTGWFTHWLEPAHADIPPEQFAQVLETVLRDYNGSINYYMFIGGTSFGFLNGANRLPAYPWYWSDITSYDYDAILTEAGDYTEKYFLAKELHDKYDVVELYDPQMPPETTKVAYPVAPITSYLSYDSMVNQIPISHKVSLDHPEAMEYLPVNNFNGQSYGFLIYRFSAPTSDGSVVTVGRARDVASLIIDGKLQSPPFESINDVTNNFAFWLNNEHSQTLSLESSGVRTIDIMVENFGRVNFGLPTDFLFRKGLHEGNITVDGAMINDIQHISLEFKKDWVLRLDDWESFSGPMPTNTPILARTEFQIEGEPQDTWLDMRNWHKGIVFINGFNLGRYFKAGPPQTLHIPAPLMNSGTNTIIVFEQYNAATEIVFRDSPLLNTPEE